MLLLLARSDMMLAAPSALGALLPCPPTRWSAPEPVCPTAGAPRSQFLSRVDRPAELQSLDDEERWLRSRAASLLGQLESDGALHIRGFELPTSKAGHRRLVGALGLRPCADPLTSIGVRALLSADDDVYEAVNAPALASTFIGLHNDATFALTAPYAAFACFRPADRGGEFLVADGREVLRALEGTHLAELHKRNVRIRVARVDLSAPLALAPEPLRAPLRAAVAAAVGAVLAAFVPLGLELHWSEDDALQICERPKSPVVRHPRTAEPTFFSSLHSQSAALQMRRAGTDAFGGVAATDAFFGDGAALDAGLLDAVEAAVGRLAVEVAMERGDVVLLDTYQCLHGRAIFEGDREHGVIWATDDDYSPPGDGGAGDGGGGLAALVNRFAVKGG